MGLLESELYAYIDELFARYAAQATEEVAPEAPVEPQVEEKTPIETTPKAEEPAVEQPVEKKESDFKFGLSAQVIYGNGRYTDDYKSPESINYRTGLFYNSFSVVIDPTVTYKNFKFGLHLTVDFRSGKFVNSFTFNANGATGIINSIMKYVSIISYEKDNFSLKIDRTTELEFKSPVSSVHTRPMTSFSAQLIMPQETSSSPHSSMIFHSSPRLTDAASMQDSELPTCSAKSKSVPVQLSTSGTVSPRRSCFILQSM